MTGLVAVLAVGHWLPAAKPITDRELLDGLGDPANAARRAKVTPELEKPDTIRWLFRVADSDDKRLRDRAAAWVTVWQANKPALTDEKLAAWGKAGELSRLVCATLEHKQRLKPITVKRGRNDPEPELPKGADLDPGVQLLAARDALIAAANKATGTKCDGRPLTYDGWDQGEELSEQLLPHLYSTAVKEYPDPFGRQRPNELNLCVESVSDAGLPGTPDARFLCTAVFGRGGLGKARGHGADKLSLHGVGAMFVEGDISIHMNTLPRFLWVNGDITIERSLDEEKCGGHLTSISGLVICQGEIRPNGGSLRISGGVFATATELDKTSCKAHSGAILQRTNAEWLTAVKASSPADYGVTATAEKDAAVIATVAAGKPLGTAGVAVGDVIAAVNGFAVKNPLQLGRELCRAEVGKGAAVLKVQRGKDTVYLHVKLAN